MATHCIYRNYTKINDFSAVEVEELDTSNSKHGAMLAILAFRIVNYTTILQKKWNPLESNYPEVQETFSDIFQINTFLVSSSNLPSWDVFHHPMLP